MPLATTPSMSPTMGPSIETSVDQPMTATPMPGSLGTGQGQLASAMMGMVTDQRAAVQQTARAMSEIAALAHRLDVMLGGSAAGAGANIYDPSVSVSHSSAASASVAGSYGSGVNNRPMIVQNFGPGAAASGSAFGSMPQNPGGGPQYAQYSGFGTQDTSSSVVLPPTSQPAGNGGSWHTPTTEEENSVGASGAGARADIVEGAAAESAAAKAAKGLRQGRSLQGIAQNLTARAEQNGWAGKPVVGRLLFGSAADEAGGAATSGIVSSYAETGNLGASLLAGGGLESAGLGVGAAYGGYRAVGAFLTDERQKNAAYQSILGGSNLSGLKQRGLSALWGLGQFGSFSPGEADQIFQQVTALGQTGGARQAGLDFVSGNYRSMGMAPNQSIDVLTTSVQNASNDLDALTASLQGVTAAASGASVNADSFRQTFIATYQAMTGAFGGGSSAAVAGALTSTFASEGQGGLGGGLDLSSGGAQARGAAALGINIGHLEAGGATLALKAQQAVYNRWGRQAATNMLGSGAGAVSGLERKDRNHQGTISSVTAQSQLGQQILNSIPGGEASLAPFLESVGVKYNPKSLTSMLTAYANYQSGDLFPAAESHLSAINAQTANNRRATEWANQHPNRIQNMFGGNSKGGLLNDIEGYSASVGNAAATLLYAGYDATLHTGHTLANTLGIRSGARRAYAGVEDVWDDIFGGGGSNAPGQVNQSMLSKGTTSWEKTAAGKAALAQINAGKDASHPGHDGTRSRSASRNEAARSRTGTNSGQGSSQVHVTVGFDQQAASLLKVVAQSTDSGALQTRGNPYTPFSGVANG